MGGVGLVACQDFLVRGACICVLVGELNLFPLECNEVSSSEFLGVWVWYSFGQLVF